MSAPLRSDAGPQTRLAATVFGLDVDADFAVPFLAGARAARTGRALRLEWEPRGERALPWPHDAERISEQLEHDGSVHTQIEAHPRAGYLISGPRYGAQLLARDGRIARIACRDARERQWQRLLIAQTLPFAAVLRGLEVFHASAVEWRGRAVGFLGASRAGKTSVALAACRHGARFLADDVLVLERADDDLRAHAGSPVAGVCAAAAPPTAQVLAHSARERIVRVPASARASSLGALFFLDRRAGGPMIPCFSQPHDAGALLAATFNFVLGEPERLRRLLDVCALAAARRVERVTFAHELDPAALAQALLRRLDE